MDDYSQMGREQLIERMRALERSGSGAALRESEERMRAILQTAVEAIITIDDRGIIESMNPAAEKLFGYKASEVIGKNVSMFMPSPYREQHDSYLENYKRSGKAKIIGIGREVVGQRKDGTIFPMDLAVSEVRLHDKWLFTGFVRDLTEKKQLEQEISEASEMEQRRIGQDLHDGICQHLAAIELMSEVLEQKLEKKNKSQATQAGEIAKHVRDVIAQTRSLARGLSPVVLEAEGLMAALKDLSDTTEKYFRVECRFRCEKPVLIPDNTIATHLFRIAQEAATNAVKHGKAKSIKIVLQKTNDVVILQISDNGVGFDQKAISAKGMGLRIMQYRAGIIGGTLSIQPSQNGTTVICSIHRTIAESAKQPSHEPKK